jgi:two-component system, chemotaxis family, response regulator PixH
MATILVVDDTLSELELISVFLQKEGHQILKSTSAKDALEKATEHLPAAVVTDVVMPGMSGFELCRSLKNNPVTQKISIVVCSSKNQEIDRLWAMKQGADAYVIKPFEPEQLSRALKSVGV